MEFVEGSPEVAKNLLLEEVEKALQGIKKVKGWGVTKKPTCLRLLVSDKVHIDIPVYAIPRKKYQLLKEAAQMHSDMHLGELIMNNKLDPSEVNLALWDTDGWMKSDPRLLHDWFENESKRFGPILKRTCRYLKAWRDHTWDKGGPSSIALMVAVCEAFREKSILYKSDSDALHAVCNSLPRIFSNDIRNPKDPEEVIFPRDMNEETQREIRENILNLNRSINDALEISISKDDVNRKLILIFGDRLPNSPDLIELSSKSEEVQSQKTVVPPIINQADKSHKSA